MVAEAAAEAAVAARQSRPCCRWALPSAFNLADTARLVARTPWMPTLAAITALCAVSKVLDQSVTQQFTFQTFGAMGDAHMIERMQITSTGAQMVSTAIFFSLAGFVISRVGLVPFARGIIPFVAATQLMPLLYLTNSSFATLACVSALTASTAIVDIPLSALISLVVPGKRMGEALSAMAAVKAAAAFFGNMCAKAIIHCIGVERLWMLYPIVAGVVLMAWPFALHLRPAMMDTE
mmetsp:Transcript_42831/g.129400  ORF Transcript_42831/g.129400 Transcript_42831/m.129400 type:complete len:236 (-) Transcript_42831:46-753(-)